MPMVSALSAHLLQGLLEAVCCFVEEALGLSRIACEETLPNKATRPHQSAHPGDLSNPKATGSVHAMLFLSYLKASDFQFLI